MYKTFVFLILSLMWSMTALGSDYQSRPEAREFVRELAEEQEFDAQALLSSLAQATYQQEVIDSISRPAEKELTWAEYQDIFLTEERIESGVKFMSEHEAALRAAHETYGVPPVIVTAIIGVETMYGQISGDYRVLDALTTLTFDYPPRAKFFRGQLKEFFRLAREEDKPITSFMGSYAGAMGLGQFIPSSYRHYAVDFDGDGLRDIWHNPTDAIGSVANYFKAHDWQQGADITFTIEPGDLPQDLFNVDLKPSISIADLAALGLQGVPEGLDQNQRVSPMRLEGEEGDEFWLGLHNFYVITRYNHSHLYAMAVFQVSEALNTHGGAN